MTEHGLQAQRFQGYRRHTSTSVPFSHKKGVFFEYQNLELKCRSWTKKYMNTMESRDSNGHRMNSNSTDRDEFGTGRNFCKLIGPG